MAKCGDMTYESYLMRRRGECDKKEETNMKVILANGMTVEGTPAQIQTAAKAFGLSVPFDGDGIHYNSETHGLLKIRDMDTRHVRNAMLKLYDAYTARFRTMSDVELASALTNGVRDKTLAALINEFARRTSISRF